jgi:hypothetical protein
MKDVFDRLRDLPEPPLRSGPPGDVTSGGWL